MNLGNLARVTAVLGACVMAAASASSSPNRSGMVGPPTAQGESSPPTPVAMEPTSALGVWRSTFGAVKIEADNSKGGVQTGAVQGVWVYQRQGQEVIGYFAGTLNGNVLQFRWQEPANPPLTGQGYVVFDVAGRQYSGKWWSDQRDRVGDWNGWRQQATTASTDPNGRAYGGDAYGGASYGQPPQPSQPPQPAAPPNGRYY